MGGPTAKYGPGGAIQAGGSQGSTIRNNLIYNAHSKGIVVAQFQSSVGSTNNVIVNNTVLVASDGQSALRIADASTGNTVLNNVLYSASTGGTRSALTASAAAIPGLVMDYNAVSAGFSTDDANAYITLAQWQTQQGKDQHSFLANPTVLFVNAAGNNYHLAATSPAIDAGTSTAAPATDLDGNPRPSGKGYDIGACECQSAAATTPPTVTGETPAPNATGVPATSTITATFNKSIQAGTLSFVLTGPNTTAVPATVSYNDTTHMATLTPSAALAASTTYRATVSGAKDAAGSTMAGPCSWSFTTASASSGPLCLWSSTAKPVNASDQDTNQVELGVKFRSDVAGSITGIRFYKGSGNTGTHVAHLWSSPVSSWPAPRSRARWSRAGSRSTSPNRSRSLPTPSTWRRTTLPRGITPTTRLLHLGVQQRPAPRAGQWGCVQVRHRRRLPHAGLAVEQLLGRRRAQHGYTIHSGRFDLTDDRHDRAISGSSPTVQSSPATGSASSQSNGVYLYPGGRDQVFANTSNQDLTTYPAQHARANRHNGITVIYCV